MIDKDVVRKIRKLLKLASGNKNANERDRALEAAANLAARHNLDLSAVEVESVPYERKKARKLDAWAYPLANAIEELFFVRVLLQSERVKSRRVSFACIVGKPENIAIASEMLSFFCKSIEEEARAKTRGGEARKSFKNGAAFAVKQKAAEFIAREAAKEFAKTRIAGETTALSVVRTAEKQKITEYLDETIQPQEVTHKPLAVDVDAFSAGARYGFSLPVQPLETKRIG